MWLVRTGGSLSFLPSVRICVQLGCNGTLQSLRWALSRVIARSEPQSRVACVAWRLFRSTSRQNLREPRYFCSELHLPKGEQPCAYSKKFLLIRKNRRCSSGLMRFAPLETWKTGSDSASSSVGILPELESARESMFSVSVALVISNVLLAITLRRIRLLIAVNRLWKCGGNSPNAYPRTNFHLTRCIAA